MGKENQLKYSVLDWAEVWKNREGARLEDQAIQPCRAGKLEAPGQWQAAEALEANGSLHVVMLERHLGSHVTAYWGSFLEAGTRWPL